MDFWTFWFDLIWHIFWLRDLIWFDAFFKSRDLIWFGHLFPMIWFDLNLQNHYRSIFWSKTWIQAKPMAPMERARWELSIGAIFVYETSFLTWLWLDFGYAQNSDLKSESNHDLIWFDAVFLPKIMIWFDLTPCKKVRDLIWFEMKSFLCRFDLIWICPPLASSMVAFRGS